MPKKKWTVLVEGQEHVVELDLHTLTGVLFIY